MKHLLLTTIAAVVLVGCGESQQSSPAPEAKPVEPVAEAASKQEPQFDPSRHERFLWGFETGGHIVSSPAIGADGTVYVGCGDYKLYALDGKTGTKKWEFKPDEYPKTGAHVFSPAIGANGTVYVGESYDPEYSKDDKFYALDGETGTKKWEFKMPLGMSYSAAIGSDGTVYIGGSRQLLCH